MTSKTKAAILGLVLLLGACGGGGQLATAHASITAGCVTGAEYAGSHDSVSNLELDGFEAACRQATTHLENWSQADAGAPDVGR